MPQQLNHIHLIFIQATILSLCFPCFFCHNNSQYATCVEPFKCGKLRKLSYPFWGGRRPLSCGYPGFELNCDDDVPLLNISSISYRVLGINFSTYTLKVARQDLWNTTCPQLLLNTTLNTSIFEIPQNSGDSDVTLYYGCADNRGQQIRLRNQFNCTVNGVVTVNGFDLSSGGPGSNVTCNSTISVPVDRTASAQALENPTSSSVNVLQSALASGFSLQWSADNAKCESCQRSGGTCVYIPESGWPELPGMPPPPSLGTLGRSGGTGSRCLSVTPASTPSAPSVFSSTPGRVRYIVGFVIVLLCMQLLILAIAIVCYRQIRYSVHRHNLIRDKYIEKLLHQHGYLALKRYKYLEIKKITKSFSDKLGEGGYGSVYKGILPDGCLVAIKVLSEINSNGEEFINEVASISRTSHVNIVSLLGFCYDGNKRALVYEFMPNMSLDKFIKNSGSSEADCCLDLDKLYKIAVGVAKGLEYLHTGCSTRIIHFDIKPQNILLDENFCPKISDFGLAKLCKKKQSALSLLGTRGTIGYIAPEILSRNFGRVSHKSDVYSYGMMVLEMAGANKIVESEENQSSENYFPDKIYELVTHDVTKNVHDSMAEEEQETIRKMILIGFWCIQTTPLERPLMSKVVEMLEGSLRSIQIPPKPVLITRTMPVQEFSPSLSAYTETENSVEVE